MTWEGERAIGVDLYYDPVVDEHVGNGPVGLIAPTWYFAPQRREVAQAGWETGAAFSGVFGDGPINGLDNPANATMLLQVAGEFADSATKARLWEAAEPFIEPIWNHDLGEFTLGFRLDEAHPRGQWNARSMAGWVCGEGDWASIFNTPNLGKFKEPSVSGVDFPRVALSEARWDGETLHLRAHPQNASINGARAEVSIQHLPAGDWMATRVDGDSVALSADDGNHQAVLIVDNRRTVIHRA